MKRKISICVKHNLWYTSGHAPHTLIANMHDPPIFLATHVGESSGAGEDCRRHVAASICAEPARGNCQRFLNDRIPLNDD
jgi:hypothetical protein